MERRPPLYGHHTNPKLSSCQLCLGRIYSLLTLYLLWPMDCRVKQQDAESCVSTQAFSFLSLFSISISKHILPLYYRIPKGFWVHRDYSKYEGLKLQNDLWWVWLNPFPTDSSKNFREGIWLFWLRFAIRVRVPFGRPWLTVPELLFNKKQLLSALQQLITSYLA